MSALHGTECDALTQIDVNWHEARTLDQVALRHWDTRACPSALWCVSSSFSALRG